MIHDLTPKPFTVSITYDVDFVPATSPLADEMKDVHPIWLDVQNGKVYPVFDVLKGSGADGEFTYPDEDPNAPRLNRYTLPSDGVLVKTFGHLHPGGLHDTFSVTRAGQTADVFTSRAKYYEPAGAVSWDVSMTTTRDDWAVAVKAGDELSISTTYDTSRASWYESMGLGVVWMHDGPGGTDPFTGTIKQRGVLTHGHLPENNNHGGEDHALADPRTTVAGPLTSDIPIGSFEYGTGDLASKGAIPSVAAGQSITFDNLDADSQNVWHSITSCKAPCTASTGSRIPSPTQPCSSTPGNSVPPVHRPPGAIPGVRRPTSTRAPTPTSVAFTRSCAARSAWFRRHPPHPDSWRSRAGSLVPRRAFPPRSPRPLRGSTRGHSPTSPAACRAR